MKLSQVVEHIEPEQIINSNELKNIEIKGISYNSKTTKKDDIFVCLVGEHVDGHAFAINAQEKGASAIVTQKTVEGINIPVLIVKDTQLVLAQISSVFYGFPSEKLRLIGVTGTNGKTTVTHLVENIFEQAGIECGLIGTLGQRLSSKDEYVSTKHTTPQSPELHEAFRNMLDSGIKHVVMEVSSHALEQHRVGGCLFDAAALTNLTQDHLDYHITMDNYFKAKSKLFIALKDSKENNKYAVINKDDSNAERFIQATPDKVRIITYGIENQADIIAKNIEYSVYGSKFDCITPIGNKTINLQMTGQFSVYNALAALAIGIGEGIELDTCVRALELTKSVAGRFEVVIREPLIIVDYAHTPDGLANVLNAAKKVVPQNGRLICLFGCGGDRDATKRPKMGGIAENIADVVIITSDNPRSEDPQQIITDILTGIKSLNSDKVQVEIDRRSAIELAIKNAGKDDVIVLAGKGHEDYQILKNETIHFDDREEARKAFKKVYSS
ncbi:MAG: UDP-N-acetylmuramoyl-L-alanyl-D-glutamate--2,6-diaminopimelate ligase [Candidatus Melainabacteria bacterium RIFOXYA12_FULL_32_12]|nr:MAG: UDP-N-acetylmuramoyl-L-alanyl-D-glutamate--2,6-diaminopimelate ligase [Candidatus Melainabacteria bacterium RIFOXYA2_FULL_32_9]OGI29857.1 MAG: UDP-N-acetylmuramoyl-L-alanyl-D-glutamate--2,6-diaminopimelate ligase [Candidatus Melainabacteria bacterium RIFOXYA12_FULL_32_12]